MAVQKSWEDEDVEELIILYSNKQMNVEELAEYFGKNKRSITSKLVKLGIYEKPSLQKDKKSVKSMIFELEKLLEITLDGTNLSKKDNLIILVNALKNKLSKAIE